MVNSIIFLASLFFSTLSFAAKDKNWRVTQSNGAQIIQWNANFFDAIDFDFWDGLASNPSLKFNLPTVIVLNSAGGKLNFEVLEAVLPYGKMTDLFSRIERESGAPIYAAVTKNCSSFCIAVYMSFKNRLALANASFGFHGASDGATSGDAKLSYTRTNDYLRYLIWRGLSPDWLDHNMPNFYKLEVTNLKSKDLAPSDLVNKGNFQKGKFDKFKEIEEFLKSKRALESDFQFYQNERAFEIVRNDRLIDYDEKLGRSIFTIGGRITATGARPGVAFRLLDPKPLEISGKNYYYVSILNTEEFKYESEILKRSSALSREKTYDRLRLGQFVSEEYLCRLSDCHITIDKE